MVTRPLVAFGVALSLAVAVAACGRKAPPRLPESSPVSLAAPLPPRG